MLVFKTKIHRLEWFVPGEPHQRNPLGKYVISSWFYDMEGHAKKCVERYCELADKTSQQLYKESTPCLDDHTSKKELKSGEELSKVCSQVVLKCLYLTHIGRSDILWSVNNCARSITKWTKVCDKRLNQLISYIYYTYEYKQHCYVANTAKQCRLGLFQDSDLAGDLEDSKSSSDGTLCIFVSHTFVSISWMCKQQTSVLHRSTESEIVPCMQDWDWTISPHLMSGIWSLQFLGTRITVLKKTGRLVNPLVKFVCPLTRFKNENNLEEWSMIWIMLILSPQKSTLLTRKLCYMCFKTTK